MPEPRDNKTTNTAGSSGKSADPRGESNVHSDYSSNVTTNTPAPNYSNNKGNNNGGSSNPPPAVPAVMPPSFTDTITESVDGFTDYLSEIFTGKAVDKGDTDGSFTGVMNDIRLNVQGGANKLKSTVMGWIGLDFDASDPANIMLPEEAGAQTLVDRQLAGDEGVFKSHSPKAAFINQAVYGMNAKSKTEYARLQRDLPPLEWNAMSAAERVTLARAPQMREQLPHAFIDTPNVDAITGELIPQQMQYFLQNGGQVDALGKPVPSSMADGTVTTSPNTGAAAEGSTSPQFSVQTIIDFAKAAGMDASSASIQEIVDDPAKWMSDRNLSMADIVPKLDADAEGTQLDGDTGDLGETPTIETATQTLDDLALVNKVETGDVATYDATTVSDDIEEIEAANGNINSDSTVTAEQIDIEAIGAGEGVLGKALDDFASQNISSIIDTSTISGKLLANKLGEGNYTDSKATVLGQMKLISGEFKDSSNNPIIPAWAQSIARSVNRTMAFSGITGTAQTSILSTALMEATLGAAEKDATFFQTLTIANLDNRQAAIINKANVLAQFEVENLTTRQEAVVANAKAFLTMDLANLTNDQQASVLNAQEYNDALLSDQSAQNVAKQFAAEGTNEFTMYYDNMNAMLEKYNAEASNSMAQFNAGEINGTRQFNATMEDSRQRFYSSMQYQIDSFNATWRQSVETTNTQMEYDAQAEDVRNSLDLTQEAQNRLWDRVDSTLDYIYKGWDSESQRDMEILKAQMVAQASSKGGTDWASKIGDWLFG
jgi:hypothetical protein